MARVEQLTVFMQAELIASLQAAVDAGEYASASDVVREALREWQLKRAVQGADWQALKRDIDVGMADMKAGRMSEFDLSEIADRGRQLLAARSPSA